MVFAFGLFFPGALAASIGWRFALAAGGWFKLHAALTAFGVLFALVGFIIAVSMTPSGSHFNHGHEVVGLIVLLLTLLQPAFTVVCRGIPSQEKDGEPISTYRRRWEVGHRMAGLLMVTIAIYVVAAGYVRTQDLAYYGLAGTDILPPPMASTVILYAIFMTAATIVLALGIKRSVARTDGPSPQLLRTTSSAFWSRPIDPKAKPHGNQFRPNQGAITEESLTMQV